MFKFLRKIFDRKLMHLVKTNRDGFATITEILIKDDIECEIYDYKVWEHNKISMLLVYSRRRHKALIEGFKTRGKELILTNTEFEKLDKSLVNI